MDSSAIWSKYQEGQIHNTIVPIAKQAVKTIYGNPTGGISPPAVIESEAGEEGEKVAKVMENIKGISEQGNDWWKEHHGDRENR